jgi:hypothetical protein
MACKRSSVRARLAPPSERPATRGAGLFFALTRGQPPHRADAGATTSGAVQPESNYIQVTVGGESI